MKGLRVMKIVQEIKFEWVWGSLESKNKFPDTITHKTFGTNSYFSVEITHKGKILISLFQ